MYYGFYVYGETVDFSNPELMFRYWGRDEFELLFRDVQSDVQDGLGKFVGVVDIFEEVVDSVSGRIEYRDSVGASYTDRPIRETGELYVFSDGVDYMEVLFFGSVNEFEKYRSDYASSWGGYIDEDVADYDPRGDLANERFRELDGFDI